MSKNSKPEFHITITVEELDALLRSWVEPKDYKIANRIFRILGFKSISHYVIEDFSAAYAAYHNPTLDNHTKFNIRVREYIDEHSLVRNIQLLYIMFRLKYLDRALIQMHNRFKLHEDQRFHVLADEILAKTRLRKAVNGYKTKNLHGFAIHHMEQVNQEVNRYKSMKTQSEVTVPIQASNSVMQANFHLFETTVNATRIRSIGKELKQRRFIDSAEQFEQIFWTDNYPNAIILPNWNKSLAELFFFFMALKENNIIPSTELTNLQSKIVSSWTQKQKSIKPGSLSSAVLVNKFSKTKYENLVQNHKNYEKIDTLIKKSINL